MLVTQMLPGIVFVIPLFIVFSKINLVNTLPGLILADMTFTVPFALIMLSAYMKELPYELVEAAMVDGAGPFRAFLSVVLPITLPGLVTVGIFSFLMPWGDLLFALEPYHREQLATAHARALQGLRPIWDRLGFPVARKCPHRDSGSHLRNPCQPLHRGGRHSRRRQIAAYRT